MVLRTSPVPGPNLTLDNIPNVHDALREFRADVFHLRTLKIEMDTSIEMTSTDQPSPDQNRLIKRFHDALMEERIQAADTELPNAANFLNQIDKWRAKRPELVQNLTDELGKVTNSWVQLNRDWGDTLPTTIADTKLRSKLVGKWMDDILFSIGFLTIPVRVNGHLKNRRLGQSMNFSSVFTDELPEEKQRQQLLEFIADEPRAINGWVDLPNGTIIKTAADNATRVKLLGLLAAIVVAPLLFLWVINSWWPVRLEWLLKEDDTFSNFIWFSLIVFAGAGFHFLIELVKVRQSGGKVNIFERFDWFITKIPETCVTAGLLWVVIFLAFYFSPKLGAGGAFFLGYSLDSMLDVLVGRFETLATGQKTRLTTMLKTAPAEN